MFGFPSPVVYWGMWNRRNRRTPQPSRSKTHVPLFRNGTAKVKRMRLPGALFVVLLLLPHPASAQSPAPQSQPRYRFFFDVNLAGSTNSLADDVQYTGKVLITGEVATFLAKYPRPEGDRSFPLLDLGGGVMLSRRVGLGLGFSQASYDNVVALTATVPHPFILQTPGTGTGETEPLRRTENATHVFVTITPYDTRRTEWRMSFGPTIFAYSADMVATITYSQNAPQGNPQNIVTVTGYTTEEASAKTLGVHVGADFAFDVGYGVAATAGGRYAVGTVGLNREPLSKGAQDIRVGDWRVFVGLRWQLGRSSQ